MPSALLAASIATSKECQAASCLRAGSKTSESTPASRAPSILSARSQQVLAEVLASAKALLASCLVFSFSKSVLLWCHASSANLVTFPITPADDASSMAVRNCEMPSALPASAIAVSKICQAACCLQAGSKTSASTPASRAPSMASASSPQVLAEVLAISKTLHASCLAFFSNSDVFCRTNPSASMVTFSITPAADAATMAMRSCSMLSALLAAAIAVSKACQAATCLRAGSKASTGTSAS